MRLSAVLRLLCCLLVASLITGCGGRGDKGKNQDLDRPKPAVANP
jgi:hypothetical protein